MTAQKAAMTLKRVRAASGFSGDGAAFAGVEGVMVASTAVFSDPESSCLLVMTRACFSQSVGYYLAGWLEWGWWWWVRMSRELRTEQVDTEAEFRWSCADRPNPRSLDPNHNTSRDTVGIHLLRKIHEKYPVELFITS